jgi:hypothetical protein
MNMDMDVEGQNSSIYGHATPILPSTRTYSTEKKRHTYRETVRKERKATSIYEKILPSPR